MKLFFLLIICLIPWAHATCDCDGKSYCGECYKDSDSLKTRYFDIRCRFCEELEKNVSIKADKNPDHNNVLIIESKGSFGKETLAAVPEVKMVRHQTVIYSEIEDESLCSPPNLKNVSIYCEKCPPATLHTFSNCNKIQEFGIGNMEIPEGALDHFHSVEHLTFAYTRKTTLNITRKTMDAFDKVKHLRIRAENEQNYKIENRAICAPKNLKTLELDTIARELNEDLLSNCESVEHLKLISESNLRRPKMGVQGGLFKNFKNLKTLYIEGVYFTISKEILEGLKKVENFEIAQSRIYVNEDGFSEMPALKHLKLHSLQSTVVDATTLKKYLPNLETFSIQHAEYPIQDVIQEDLRREFPFIKIL